MRCELGVALGPRMRRLGRRETAGRLATLLANSDDPAPALAPDLPSTSSLDVCTLSISTTWPMTGVRRLRLELSRS